MLTSAKRSTKNLENDNSGPCPTGSTRNGTNHRVLPPVGGNGVVPGGLPKNSKKVKKRGKQRFAIEPDNPLFTELWRKPLTNGIQELILF